MKRARLHTTRHVGKRMALEWSVRVMMFNATFNNISALSWRSVLFAAETRVPGEHPPTGMNCFLLQTKTY